MLWANVGIDIPPSASVSGLWELARPEHLPAKFFHTYLLLCSWQIWKHRNEVIFRGAEPSLLRLLLACKEEARLWRCRLPRSDQGISEAWCHSFCSNM
ncbi:hypothetical protein PAHAL_3G485700 [Panicum hallii]|uniref:Reverse transcriptase zinc-binding domain-containing protein n=1 Tax=Panicum hallii TaxID=206008 RepID=A0A2T8KLX5_9POAL|nr:hypothetical protein PAHAL_3G485700 [Panicum hallii]